MKTAKLGAMFLISVLALAGIGAGYAAWTDTITIIGTVNTGTVDIVIEGLSGTEVYKDLDDDSCDIYYYLTDENGVLIHGYWDGPEPIDPYLVAWGNATKTGDDEITFELVNLFPSIDFMVDAKLHYVGSIPVKINSVDIQITSLTGFAWMNPLINSGDISAAIYRWDPETHTIGESVCVGDQLEYCDYLVVVLCVHIPQDDQLPDAFPFDTAMYKSGGVTVTIEFIQWNEYNNG